MSTVAIDIDGTLADQVPHVLDRANREKGTRMRKSDVTEWNTPVGGEPFDQLILRYLEDPEFVRTMPEIPGAPAAVRRLRENARILIASSRPESTEAATLAWLKSKLGWVPEFKNTVREGKATLDASVLIDDNDENVVGFARSANADPRKPHEAEMLQGHRYGVLLRQPWNGKSKSIPTLVAAGRLFLVKNWSEVLTLFGK